MEGKMEAGNTTNNMFVVDRDVAATSMEAVDTDVALVGEEPISTEELIDEVLDTENTFDVSRKEFDELQDAFLRFVARVDKYNQGAPHKI
jgi:hypothetical protein